MGRPLLAFLLSFSFAIALAGAQASFNSTTAAYANGTVSNAAYYIAQVNESSYLVFYPHLTQAYADLFRAEGAYNTSPSTAVIFANMAVSEARAEYQRISIYRAESVVAMAALTVLFALLISRAARPVRRDKKKGR